MMWIASGFSSFYIGGSFFSARSGKVISDTRCMIPQSFAVGENRSYTEV
jgi:hypothetical protein